MKFSVIIPFYNAKNHIKNCLVAFIRQRYEEYELILVNNASTDGSEQVVQSFIEDHPEMPIQLMEEKRPGASAARNKGASKAKGTWVVFTDSDCIPSPNWLEDLSIAIKTHPECGGFAGCILPAPSLNIISRFLGLFTLPRNRMEVTYTSFRLVEGGFPTANLAVNKKVYDRVGGFDERILIYGEDWELCVKVYSADSSIRALTNAIVYHDHRTSIKAMVKQTYGFGICHAMSLRRLVPGALIIATPIYSKTEIILGHRIWIDLNSADKKIIGLILAGIIWDPFWIFLPIYIIFLCSKIIKIGSQNNTDVKIKESPIFVTLLFIKSASITAGRLIGSIRNRVFCI